MKTLIFIHGANSHVTEQEYLDWLRNEYPNWLKEEWQPSRKKWKHHIAERFISEWEKRVFMPQMPSDLNARYEEWIITFDGLLSNISPSDELTLVWHSLGGCFLLKYFSEIKDFSYQIDQIHLLAACISEWDFTPPSNYEFLQKIENRVHIWHAEDDSVVPFSVGQEIAKNLPHSEIHFFASEKWYGHFHRVERIPELEFALLKK